MNTEYRIRYDARYEVGYFGLCLAVRVAYARWLKRRGLRDTIEEQMAEHRTSGYAK